MTDKEQETELVCRVCSHAWFLLCFETVELLQ